MSKNLIIELYDRFVSNLQKHIDDQRVNLYRDYSSNSLIKLTLEIQNGTRTKYNFVYIDGSHQAPDVLMDAVLSWKLLEVGGIMIFDDYLWPKYKNSPSMHPKTAIDGFLASYTNRYKTLHMGYQVHIQKTTSDPS